MRIKGIKIDEDVAKILNEAWGGSGNDPLLSSKSKQVKNFKDEVTDAIFESDKVGKASEMLSALVVLKAATRVSSFTGRLSKVKMNTELQNRLSNAIDEYISLFPHSSRLLSSIDPDAQDFNMPIIDNLSLGDALSKDGLTAESYQSYLELVNAAYNILPPINAEYRDNDTVTVLPNADIIFFDRGIIRLAETWVDKVNAALHDIVETTYEYINWLAQYKRAFESLQNAEITKIEDEE